MRSRSRGVPRVVGVIPSRAVSRERGAMTGLPGLSAVHLRQIGGICHRLRPINVGESGRSARCRDLQTPFGLSGMSRRAECPPCKRSGRQRNPSRNSASFSRTQVVGEPAKRASDNDAPSPEPSRAAIHRGADATSDDRSAPHGSPGEGGPGHLAERSARDKRPGKILRTVEGGGIPTGGDPPPPAGTNFPACA